MSYPKLSTKTVFMGQKWGGKYLKKEGLYKKIKFDYTKLVERGQSGKYKMIGDNKMLFSVSTLLKVVHDYFFFSIPERIIKQRRELGANLMINIQSCFENKITDLTQMIINERDRIVLSGFIKWAKDTNTRILAVEKFITNGNSVCIIDCIVQRKYQFFVLEIKCRNNLEEIRSSDLLQLRAYIEMFGAPGILLIIDDNGNYKEYVYKSKKFMKKEWNTLLNFYKDNFNIDITFQDLIEVN